VCPLALEDVLEAHPQSIKRVPERLKQSLAAGLGRHVVVRCPSLRARPVWPRPSAAPAVRWPAGGLPSWPAAGARMRRGMAPGGTGAQGAPGRGAPQGGGGKRGGAGRAPGGASGKGRLNFLYSAGQDAHLPFRRPRSCLHLTLWDTAWRRALLPSRRRGYHCWVVNIFLLQKLFLWQFKRKKLPFRLAKCTFRTLFRTSEAILAEPPLEGRGGAIYRFLPAL